MRRRPPITFSKHRKVSALQSISPRAPADLVRRSQNAKPVFLNVLLPSQEVESRATVCHGCTGLAGCRVQYRRIGEGNRDEPNMSGQARKVSKLVLVLFISELMCCRRNLASKTDSVSHPFCERRFLGKQRCSGSGPPMEVRVALAVDM